MYLYWLSVCIIIVIDMSFLPGFVFVFYVFLALSC